MNRQMTITIPLVDEGVRPVVNARGRALVRAEIRRVISGHGMTLPSGVRLKMSLSRVRNSPNHDYEFCTVVSVDMGNKLVLASRLP